jgi:hypothetical protein
MAKNVSAIVEGYAGPEGPVDARGGRSLLLCGHPGPGGGPGPTKQKQAGGSKHSAEEEHFLKHHGESYRLTGDFPARMTDIFA